MKNLQELETQILQLLKEQLQLEVSSSETDLLDSGLLDSLGFVDLLVLLEQHFGIQVDLESVEIESFRTVRGIAQLS